MAAPSSGPPSPASLARTLTLALALPFKGALQRELASIDTGETVDTLEPRRGWAPLHTPGCEQA